MGRVDLKQQRKSLEVLVRDGKVYCKFHKKPVGLKTMYQKRCYVNYHGRGFCPYAQIRKEE